MLNLLLGLEPGCLLKLRSCACPMLVAVEDVARLAKAAAIEAGELTFGLFMMGAFFSRSVCIFCTASALYNRFSL